MGNPPPSDNELLVQANRAFYEAFELRDLRAMAEVWEHSDRVFCAHPGRPPVHGWLRVSASWYRLFSNLERLQFVITGETVDVSGDIGWVWCEENLLDDGLVGRTPALNVFARAHDGSWRMLGHVGCRTRV